MKPVEQTIIEKGDGNCFAACVASILELSIEDVPHFRGRDWFDRWREWFAERNMTLYSHLAYTSERGDSGPPPAGYSILSARSPRIDGHHAVVCFNGEIVHDPHPQREMGVGEWVEFVVFGVLDPSKIRLPES